MRVRISYSVDIADVAVETSELLSKRASELEAALNSLEDAVHCLSAKDPDLGVARNTIDKVREKLTQVDMTLADCHGILTGLEEAYEHLNHPPASDDPLEAIVQGMPDEPDV